MLLALAMTASLSLTALAEEGTPASSPTAVAAEEVAAEPTPEKTPDEATPTEDPKEEEPAAPAEASPTPSAAPTAEPSAEPSATPSATPTAAPSATPAPTAAPTAAPEPTALPENEAVLIDATEETAEEAGTDTAEADMVTAFVTRLYTVILGRQPDGPGLVDNVSRLASHSLTGAQLISGFFDSGEYKGRNRTTDQIISDAYNAMLGRDADPTGLLHWRDAFGVGMTVKGILSGFCGSQEFMNLCASYGIIPGTVDLSTYRDQNYARTAFVHRLYQNCLGRAPDTAGLENWTYQLARGWTGIQVANSFLTSAEFLAKNQSNTRFVQTLYNTLLGRTADTTGLLMWVEKLNNTSSRQAIMNGLYGSAEFLKQCQDANIALGSFIGTPDNSTSWKMNVAIAAYTNLKRTVNGRGRVFLYTPLYNAAVTRTNELTKSFKHYRPNGSYWTTALTDERIPAGTYSQENIGGLYKDSMTNTDIDTLADKMMSTWMGTDNNKDKILDPNVNAIGTSIAEGTMNKKTTFFFAQLLLYVSD